MTNLAIIEQLYQDFATGNVPGVIANMHESMVWNEAENFPYADGNPYIGPQAVVEGVFARCLTDWEGFAAHMTTLFDAGDHIIATGRYAGKNKNSGLEMNPQAVHVWTLENGKIVKFQQHIDTLNVHRAMG
ncbi:nuclear transport factor 2 family protein [Glaciecola sp. SC05]|uniref:nuclear transport factor 2 family protein n=1 Tax=Glaciecola sp. SC05 TaxID=1987355 RepID=UPI0035275D71